MKVFRIIALGLFIPLSGMAVVAVYLNAQELPPPVPRPVPGASGPERFGPTLVREVERKQNQIAGHRIEYYPSALDPKTLQLLSDERAADEEAQGLAATYSEAGNDELRGNIKKQLKEKLAAIFEMQQKRRTAEIASIEERLAKLKDVSKKRETNREAIVDRRLEQLTGGVDDLGWEESNRGAGRYPVGGGLYIEPGPNSFRVPTIAPGFNVPAAEPPARATTPSPAK